jgi:hypothetical protein
MPGPVYFATISSAASTGVVKDFFQVTASTTDRLSVREVSFGTHSAGLGSSGLVPVTIFRGSTAACSGGSTGTPIKRDSRNRAAVSLLEFSASSPTTGGSIVYSASWNVRERFVWRPESDERPVIGLGERLNVRVGAPLETITWDGSVIFEEVGTPASG